MRPLTAVASSRSSSGMPELGTLISTKRPHRRESYDPALRRTPLLRPNVDALDAQWRADNANVACAWLRTRKPRLRPALDEWDCL